MADGGGLEPPAPAGASARSFYTVPYRTVSRHPSVDFSHLPTIPALVFYELLIPMRKPDRLEVHHATGRRDWDRCGKSGCGYGSEKLPTVQ